MKLQEAFMERNDLKKKITRALSELNTVIITEEEDTPQFDPQKKLDEINTLQTQLEKLNIAIDYANQINTPTLHRQRYVDAMIAHYTTIRNTLLAWKRKQTLGYGDTVIQMQKNFDLYEITKELEKFETEKRELDRRLQKSNWEVEVLV